MTTPRRSTAWIEEPHGHHATTAKHAGLDELLGHRLRHPSGTEITQGAAPVPVRALAQAPRHHWRPWLWRFVLPARQSKCRPHGRLAAQRPAARIGPRVHAL